MTNNDDPLESWILSGRYVPTRDDVRSMPWTKDAYNKYLAEKSGGRLMTAFCGVCGADDSHHSDCYMSARLMPWRGKE